MPHVLHVLAQRPSLTGSGVTLDALVRQAADAGWAQTVAVGVPTEEAAAIRVGPLCPPAVRALRFASRASDAPGADAPQLPFAVPGMSDVMPYESTCYSSMTPGELAAYRDAWRAHLTAAIVDARPDVIHSHHVWLVSAMLKDIAPHLPLVIHCHATGLRQMELCPHLAGEVRAGCARADRFVVLSREHAALLARALDVPAGRVEVVGAGYREELFAPPARPEPARDRRLLFVGKYSQAKGLPWLLDAVARLAPTTPGLELHVAGSGAGDEATALAARLSAMAPLVVRHGQLPQADLAALMQRCGVCVLPSLYEGVPLVLVEALACGCRLVATDLPGVRAELAPHLAAPGGALPVLELVAPPRLISVDRPVAEDLPAFVERLAAAIAATLARGPLGDPERARPGALERFRWGAVFRRVEAVWRQLLDTPSLSPAGLS